jgi:hypothetical protein
MDMQTYATRTEAEATIETMRGWDAEAEEINIGPDDETAWSILCDGTKYLRTDGYVR